MAQAQTPGGTTYNTEIWLQADKVAGNTFMPDRASVNQWENKGSVALNFVRTANFNVPVYNHNGYNFQPMVTFRNQKLVSNTNYRTYPNTATPPDTSKQYRTFYVAASRMTGSNYGVMLSMGNNFSEGFRNNANYLYYANSSGGLLYSFNPGLSPSKRYGIISFDRNNGYAWQNAKPAPPPGSTSLTFGNYNTPAIVGAKNSGTSMSYSFEGDIMEVIVISKPGGAPPYQAFDELEVKKINSYLAIKYGLTLESDQPQFYNSDGTTVWNGSDPNFINYNNNVFGLARDNASGLNLRQSIHQEGQTLAVFLGPKLEKLNAQNNATPLADKTYLMFGSNGKSGVALLSAWGGSGTYTNNTTIPADITHHQNVIFKTRLTGASSVKVNLFSHITADYILVSNDPTFPQNNTAAYEVNDGIATGVDLNDSKYIGFALQPKGPGAVNDGLKMWLRADDPNGVELYNGTDRVQKWADLNSNKFYEYVQQYTSSGNFHFRPGFVQHEPKMNFHPSLHFAGDFTNRHFEYLNTDAAPFSTAQPGSYSLMTVVNVNVYGEPNTVSGTAFRVTHFLGFGEKFARWPNPGNGIPDRPNSSFPEVPGGDATRARESNWNPAFGVAADPNLVYAVGRYYQSHPWTSPNAYYGMAVNGAKRLFKAKSTTIALFEGKVTSPKYLNFEFDGYPDMMTTGNRGDNNNAINNTNFNTLFGTGTNTVMNGKGTLGIGSYANRNLNGYMSEVIAYENKILDTNEKQKINSYFGLKYGLTIDMDKSQDGTAAADTMTNFNYVLADGNTLVWPGNTPGYRKYHHNVAALVRDDASNLNNRQSNSTGDGRIVLMGFGTKLGNNPELSPGLQNDKESIVWGHDGTPPLSTENVIGQECADIVTRMNRIWRLDVNTQQNYQVLLAAGSNDDDDFAYNRSSWKVTLLLASSPTAFASQTWDQAIPGVYVDGKHQFNVHLQAGKTYYFTFGGMQVPSTCPTCGFEGRKSITFQSSTWSNKTTERPFNLGDGFSANLKNTGTFANNYPRVDAGSLVLYRTGNSSNVVTTEIKVTAGNAALVSFMLSDIDSPSNGHERIEIEGYCGTEGPFYPTLGYVRPESESSYHIFGNGIAQAVTTKDHSATDPKGQMRVNFTRAVDRIVMKYSLFGTPRSIGTWLYVGPIEFRCPPPPPPINEDGLGFTKDVSRDTVELCEDVTYLFRIVNTNCDPKTVRFTDVLPAGMLWMANSASNDSLPGINSYAGTDSIDIPGIVVPGGKEVIFTASAHFAPDAPDEDQWYDNRAKIKYSKTVNNLPKDTIAISYDAYKGDVPTSVYGKYVYRYAPLKVVSFDATTIPNVTPAYYWAGDTVTVALKVNNPNPSIVAPITNLRLSFGHNEEFTLLTSSIQPGGLILGPPTLEYEMNGVTPIPGRFYFDVTFPAGEHTLTFKMLAPAKIADLVQAENEFGVPLTHPNGKPVIVPFNIAFEFSSQDPCAKDYLIDMGGSEEVQPYLYYTEHDRFTVQANRVTVIDILTNESIDPSITGATGFNLLSHVTEHPKGGTLSVSGSYGVNSKLLYHSEYIDENTGLPKLTNNIDSCEYTFTMLGRTWTTKVYIYVLHDENGATACLSKQYTVKLTPKPSGVTFHWNSGFTGSERTVTQTDSVSYWIRPAVPNADKLYKGEFPQGRFTVSVGNKANTKGLRWTGLFGNNWQLPENWVELRIEGGKVIEVPATWTPGLCTDVEISSNVDNFPELTTTVYARNILMKDRAMLKNPHVLQYDSASVEIKLKPSERGRFVMWSAPLSDMKSGDYRFGNTNNGDVFMNFFQHANPDGGAAAKNNFTATIGALDYPLPIGKAFNLNVTDNSVTRESLLKFGTPSSKSITKFITKDLSAKGGNNYTLPLESNNTFDLVQVVNPYMAYLRADTFFQENSALIKPGYYIWNGELTSGITGVAVQGSLVTGNRYVYNGPFDFSSLPNPNLIPPLQSFFVAKQSTANLPSLTISPAFTTTKPESSYTLRSSVASGGVLNIKVSQGTSGEAYTALAYTPGTSNFIEKEDMPVLMYDKLLTAVYTFATSGEALSINSSAAFDLAPVKLGLRVKNAGGVKLEFENLSTFGHNVVLKDNLLDKEVNLQQTPEYTFTVTKQGSDFIDVNDRFTLLMNYTGKGITLTGTETAEASALQVSGGAGYIYLKSNAGVIGYLQIFNATGQLVYSTGNLNESQFRLPVNGQQIYLVRAGIGSETIVEKVFVK
ncbi:hypothetical protein FACS189411_05820 [Bacteroidia bacterium]|nr:hypothetical protein FACS189411_05820 [Bacteroidia bacterium]